MISESHYKNILEIVRGYCSRSEKCSADVLKKLEFYELTSEQRTSIIETLKSEKFIDHQRYAKAFVNDKFKFNKWGKIKIYQALKAKNIESEIAREQLENIDEDEYLEMLKILLKAKNKQIKETDLYKRKASIFRFGMSKGFEFEIISQVYKVLE
jgi:regulatory protein